MSMAVLYLNGRLVPAAEAAISPLDAGFQYGDGAFETLLAREGRPQFRADHYERLRTTLSFLDITPVPADAELDAAIDAVLRGNVLSDAEARVKIIVSRASAPAQGPTLCITASPYSRPAVTDPFRLQTVDIAHASPFAGWKTLSYGMYRAAWLNAGRNGFDDAVFRTPDGSLLETSTAALIAWDGEQWLITPSDQRLDSIAARHICLLLEERGFRVSRSAPRSQDIPTYRAMWACNTLRLVQPVTGIDDWLIRGPAPLPPAELREAMIIRGSHK